LFEAHDYQVMTLNHLAMVLDDMMKKTQIRIAGTESNEKVKGQPWCEM